MKQSGGSSSGPMGPGPRYSPNQARQAEAGLTGQRPGQLGSQFTPKLASARAIALRGVFQRGLTDTQAGRVTSKADPNHAAPKDGMGQGRQQSYVGTYGGTRMPHKQVQRSSPTRSTMKRAEPADGSTPGPVASR